MFFKIPSRRESLFVPALQRLTWEPAVKGKGRAVGHEAASWIRGWLRTAAVCGLLMSALIATTWHIYSARVAHDRALPVYHWNEIIRCDESHAGPRERAYLIQGWSAPGGGLSWILGQSAELAFQVDQPASTVLFDAAVVKNMTPEVPDQLVSLSVNGRHVTTLRVSAPGRIQVVLPADVFAPDRPIFVRLDLLPADAVTAASRQPSLALSWFGLHKEWPFSTLEYDTKIPFSAGGRADGALHEYLRAGWSEPDPRTSWIENGSAAIAFNMPRQADDSYLEADLKPLIAEPLRRQRLNVSVNGTAIAALAIDRNSRVRLPLPRMLWRPGQPVVVTFEAPDSRSPASLGLSMDTRELSFAFRSVVLRRGLLPDAVVLPHEATWLGSVRASLGFD